MINSNMINKYGSMFFESGEGSSSSAAPPPPPDSEEVPQPFSVPQGPATYPPTFGVLVSPPPPPDDAEGSEAPPDWAGCFSTETLVGQDIHLLIRVWMMIFIFISTFSPYLVHLSYSISFPDFFIGWSSHLGGPAWDSWQGKRSTTTSPPGLSWMLDDKGGEDSD
jgi:hypothetical protein